MSDRLYVDPVTNSVREERALFSFCRKLGKTSGQFFRLGVLTYCRVLCETGTMPKGLEAEYRYIAEKDRDYLERLMRERIDTSEEQYDKACVIELPTVNGKTAIDWDSMSEETRLPRYIKTIMPEDFRAFWISKYNCAEEEGQFDVLTDFANDVICRNQADPEKPFRITDKNEVRKILRSWAESAGGFS